MVRNLKGIGLGLLLCCSGATAEVMLGAYVPGDGFSREEIQNFNSVVPKSLAFINIFSSFSHDWDYVYHQATNIVAEGAMPLVSWMPVDLENPDDNILIEIALGTRDDYIDEWGAKLLAWIGQYEAADQPRMLLRFGHEFNGGWFSYGNSPIFYQAAWRYIHDRFEASGVNQHVEWVWSANNISVDDYDDITVYYPGDEYVDWTSLNGYNFGSNYAWTDWESFEDIYSDAYLTLVNNYPEKPILIAEVGSAEESDLPDAIWGQFGDDRDSYESKSSWIEDMLLRLEEAFPAVRAVAWFNFNKELSWSITEQNSSGMAAFIAGVQSDYYTGSFISANGQGVTDSTELEPTKTVQRTELELAAMEADRVYTLAQDTFAVAEGSLNEANNAVADAQGEQQLFRESRAEALLAFQVTRRQYAASREKFLSLNQAAIDSQQGLANQRFDTHQLKSLYLNEKGVADSARDLFLEKRTNYQLVNQKFVIARQEFYDAKASLVNATASLKAAEELQFADGLDQDLLTAAVAEAVEIHVQAREKFLLVRAEFLAVLDNFLDVRVSHMSAAERRDNTRSNYLASIDLFDQLKSVFYAALQNREGPFGEIVESRKSLVVARSAYQALHGEFATSTSALAELKNGRDNAQSDFQQADEARLQAYKSLTSANYLVALEGNSISKALLSDGLNDNGAGQSKQDIKVASEANIKTKTRGGSRNVVKIVNRVKQKAMAESRKPEPMDPDKLALRKHKCENMTSQEKADYKHRKMSVLAY